MEEGVKWFVQNVVQVMSMFLFSKKVLKRSKKEWGVYGRLEECVWLFALLVFGFWLVVAPDQPQQSLKAKQLPFANNALTNGLLKIKKRGCYKKDNPIFLQIEYHRRGFRQTLFRATN